jgi:L-lactate dehydrogenase complex protein LldG
MSSRDEILASIRANRPRLDRPLPDLPLYDHNAPPQLLSMFKGSLQRMGGLFLESPAPGDPLLPVRDKIAGAKVVCTTAPEITGNREIGGIGRPQDLADIDFAIVRASFAVAEAGSVLLNDMDLRVNALAYLAQHLIVLLDPADIVVNLHHAYRRPEFRPARRRCRSCSTTRRSFWPGYRMRSMGWRWWSLRLRALVTAVVPSGSTCPTGWLRSSTPGAPSPRSGPWSSSGSCLHGRMARWP